MKSKMLCFFAFNLASAGCMGKDPIVGDWNLLLNDTMCMELADADSQTASNENLRACFDFEKLIFSIDHINSGQSPTGTELDGRLFEQKGHIDLYLNSWTPDSFDMIEEDWMLVEPLSDGNNYRITIGLDFESDDGFADLLLRGTGEEELGLEMTCSLENNPSYVFGSANVLDCQFIDIVGAYDFENFEFYGTVKFQR